MKKYYIPLNPSGVTINILSLVFDGENWGGQTWDWQVANNGEKFKILESENDKPTCVIYVTNPPDTPPIMEFNIDGGDTEQLEFISYPVEDQRPPGW